MSSTRYGRYQVAEAPSALACLHLHHDGITLRHVDHEPKVAVLDQEDLIRQGIYVDTFIPGAQRVDALGSCTANGTTAALSNLLSQAAFAKFVHGPRGFNSPNVYADAVAAERAAIRFYHACTDQTGDPGQEWPPTDCGSSGPYIVSECKRQGLASGAKLAHGAQNIVSLMQSGGLLMGSPWFMAWEEPDGHGFIDGNGSASALRAAIASGVAGGHETFLAAIESIAVDAGGTVIPEKTVLRGRNSWDKPWGDHGDYRIHLSTVAWLGQYIDLRQLVA